MSGKAMGWARADAMRIGTTCTKLLKARVRRAFKGRCEYCGIIEQPEAGHQALHGVDRIVPGLKGGRYLPANVTLACKRCNSAKSFRHDAPASVRSLADMEALS